MKGILINELNALSVFQTCADHLDDRVRSLAFRWTGILVNDDESFGYLEKKHIYILNSILDSISESRNDALKFGAIESLTSLLSSNTSFDWFAIHNPIPIIVKLFTSSNNIFLLKSCSRLLCKLISAGESNDKIKVLLMSSNIFQKLNIMMTGKSDEGAIITALTLILMIYESDASSSFVTDNNLVKHNSAY